MKTDSFLFDARPQYPLVLTAKRYQSDTTSLEDGATLIFAHGTGFHKEHWEPVIQHLFEKEGTAGGFKIREAWSFDCPNHGDAALLNDKVLTSGCYDQLFGWEEYGRIIHSTLTGLGNLTSQGTDEREVRVDFTKRKLIAIGHSMGAISLILTQTFHPSIHFESFILVDPVLITSKHERMFPGSLLDLAGGASRRRDVWSSRENALDTLISRPSWQAWDERILKIYVEHGLYPIPESDPEGRSGVTLKCARTQEAACYRDILGRTRAYEYLSTLCNSSKSQVHIIWGAINDHVRGEIKEDVEKVAAEGKLTSVSRILGAGHLAPQTDPSGVADAIWLTFSHGTSKSRL